jgi:hypothetical protein
MVSGIVWYNKYANLKGAKKREKKKEGRKEGKKTREKEERFSFPSALNEIFPSTAPHKYRVV